MKVLALFQQVLIILALLLPLQSTASEPPQICVLNYERAIHPFTKVIKQQFKNVPQARVIHEAVPLDFLNCIHDGVSEITIVAHAFQIDTTGTQFRLGYFVRETPEERAQSLQNLRNKLLQQQYDFQEQWRDCTQVDCQVRDYRVREATIGLETIDSLPADYPIYNKKIFLNRVFEDSRDYLRSLKQSGKRIQLKQLRFMNCEPGKIFEAYPALRELISENNIHLDVAPSQALMSLVKGAPVTTMDSRWLAESAQFDDANNLNDGFYIYLNLKDFGVYQTGTATGLRGQYTINVQGLAFGFASKWSKVFIRYSDVQNMKVGEVKSIVVPQFDLSLALWANGEVKIGPNSEILGTTETNSIGFSLGLLQNIEIRRNY